MTFKGKVSPTKALKLSVDLADDFRRVQMWEAGIKTGVD
jgi:hypothetical protein